MWQITYTPGHRSTGDGLSSIVVIVIGATAGTILLSICAIGLLCVKGFCSDSSSKNKFSAYTLLLLLQTTLFICQF